MFKVLAVLIEAMMAMVFDSGDGGDCAVSERDMQTDRHRQTQTVS